MAAQFLESNAGPALRRGRDTISRAYGWAQDAAEGVHLRSLRLPQRSDLSHLTEANPLLLGAVGLGLGVAIGSLFPRGMMSRRTAGRGRRPANGPVMPVKSVRRRRKKTRASNAKTRAATAAAS
jgi:hypothetical protein